MDNIINQRIGFESEIHIQVDVEEKNAEGKIGKYLKGGVEKRQCSALD